MPARIAAYGTWSSPWTAERIAAETVGLGQIVLHGEEIYFLESRPAEGGRNVIMRAVAEGGRVRLHELLPAPFNARTRVHEYGGGAFTVAPHGQLYFVHFADQRIYALPRDGPPRPLTPPDEGRRRYADLVYDARRRRLLAVCEEHGRGGEPVNYLAAIDLDGGQRGVRALATGADFCAAPRLAADGRRLAWLAWHHPNMPWDGCELMLAAVRDDGTLSELRCVAGGPEESIFQPEFGPDGALYFVSDRSGWWNLYRYDNGRVESLAPLEAEFGQPQWVFGLSTYGFVSPTEIVCAYCREGVWRLALLDLSVRRLAPIETPYTDIAYLRAAAGRAYFIGVSPLEPPALVALEPGTRRIEVLRRSCRQALDEAYLSRATPLAFPTGEGETAHAFYYAPQNRDFTPPPGERPPLVVFCHGGPTAAASSALNLRIQYWTSRGFAVCDVNYRGSTGFGRDYRRRLDGQWGVVDVEDCLAAARALVAAGQADPRRLAIRGGSAGGYTALSALVFHDVFTTGASLYGVSDLERLAQDTHKFEKHYLDRLVGPYPAARALYRARSPLYHAARLRRPVIFFQGLEDKVVPPDQTERMVQALAENGVPVAFVLFPDEAHGFRRAENIRRALEAELYFYGRIFGLTPADDLEPVAIRNL